MKIIRVTTDNEISVHEFPEEQFNIIYPKIKKLAEKARKCK